MLWLHNFYKYCVLNILSFRRKRQTIFFQINDLLYTIINCEIPYITKVLLLEVKRKYIIHKLDFVSSLRGNKQNLHSVYILLVPLSRHLKKLCCVISIFWRYLRTIFDFHNIWSGKKKSTNLVCTLNR